MHKLICSSLAFLNIAAYPAEADLLFQEILKVELHLHLGGSYPLEYLMTIATEPQRETLLKQLDLISKKIEYHEAFKVFGLIGQIVNTDEKVEKGTVALCHSLEKDGVVYAEIRTGLKDLGSGFEGYLQSVLRGMKLGSSPKMHARLLLSLQRASSPALAKSTVDLAILYKQHGVVGIDVSGDSTLGQIEPIIPELLRAKEAGLFLTVHMGESPKEQGQEEILKMLKPHRIGHGVHLTREALNWVFENRVPIEVCPTSAVLVRMVDDYSEIPALRYFILGHPTIICTDDPLIFQNSLSQEYLTLSQRTSLNVDQLCQMAKNAFDHTFLSEEEKQSIFGQYHSLK